MNRQKIYPKEWLTIHPYTATDGIDLYYTELANRLYGECRTAGIDDHTLRKVCLYVAAYLEDTVSEGGLWRAFTEENRRLYGRTLPFYTTGDDYMAGEVNGEDVRFIVWNTLCLHAREEKGHGAYVNPMEERVRSIAGEIYAILAEEYETAPENGRMRGVFNGYRDAGDAERKLTWLAAHTYLTEPSMSPYVDRMSPQDKYIMPTGPHALFLHEWIDLLRGGDGGEWRNVEGLYFTQPQPDEGTREQCRRMYEKFIAGTEERTVHYIDGYEGLREFLTKTMGWPDDDDHTLPQLRAHRDFVLMAEPEKGMLIARDVCRYIADPENPLYNKEEAATGAFRMLTVPMACPPDLLTRCIKEGWLPDAAFPGGEGRETVQENLDFIARHALLYYYRGD